MKISEEKVSQTLSTAILQRAFKDAEFKNIWEAYKYARKRHGNAAQPPTEFQKKVAKEFKETACTYVALTKKYKVPHHVITGAVNKVSVYAFLNA